MDLFFSRQIFMDLLLAFGSMATIAICICIQTQSFWITGFAVFGIFMSFMEANFVYRVILDYRYVKCISSIKVPLLAQFSIWSAQDDPLQGLHKRTRIKSRRSSEQKKYLLIYCYCTKDQLLPER